MVAADTGSVSVTTSEWSFDSSETYPLSVHASDSWTAFDNDRGCAVVKISLADSNHVWTGDTFTAVMGSTDATSFES